MEHRYAWLLAFLAAVKWLLVAVLLAAVAWWIWKKRLYRYLLVNGGHGLAAVAFGLLFVIAAASVGPTEGFGAWSLIPVVLGAPPVALVLVIWGLVARARSSEPTERRAALSFTILASLPAFAVIVLITGSG